MELVNKLRGNDMFRVIVLCVLLTSCDSSFNEIPKTEYTTEEFRLPDGTPCHIIRGGTYSGMVGITCNYKTDN